MDQTFFRSVTESSRLATGTSACVTSNAFTDPAFLAFWASMEFGVPAWTSTRVYDWKFYGIIAAIFVCRLGNFLICLLGVFEFFSSRPNKASTAGMNVGIGSYCSSGCYGHIVSCKSLVTLFPATFFPSILSAFVVAYCIFAWDWEVFTLLVFQLFHTVVFQLLLIVVLIHELCFSFNQYAHQTNTLDINHLG